MSNPLILRSISFDSLIQDGGQRKYLIMPIAPLRYRFINLLYKKHEKQLLTLGKILSSQQTCSEITSLSQVEFSIFSQWGDDGIIQWLLKCVDFKNKSFIEFGVEDYRESNTRFLLMNNNWSGGVIDGSQKNIKHILNSEYYWKHNLTAKHSWITKGNIHKTIDSLGLGSEVGILHIDIDGNDYWIWKELDGLKAELVIIEYNSALGNEESITVPYDDKFNRTEKHFSNLYYGASLPALHKLGVNKGYTFIGCNSAGNNAYFLKDELVNQRIPTPTLSEGYVESKFRESRKKNNEMSFLSGHQRFELIRNMPFEKV